MGLLGTYWLHSPRRFWVPRVGALQAREGQGSIRMAIHHGSRGGYLPLDPPPPLQTKVTSGEKAKFTRGKIW